MSECNYFYGSQAGAPSLGSVGTGDLVAVLDACLVNGYNTVTLTSLAESGSPGVALANKTAHGFRDQQMLTISGATPSAYNGNWRCTVIDADNFSFDLPNGASGSASGTIQAKVSPLGWAIAFTGTSQRAYRAPTGNRLYLQVIDNADTKTAKVRGYRIMTAVASGLTGPFPTSTQSVANLRWSRPDVGTNPTNDWVLIGDDKRFWFGPNAYSDLYRQWVRFGDFKSFLPADAYNCAMGGASNADGSDTVANYVFPSTGQPQVSGQGSTQWIASSNLFAVARDYLQATDSKLCGLLQRMGGGNPTEPNFSSVAGGPPDGTSSPISGGIELEYTDVVEVNASGYYFRRGRLECLSSWSRPDFANNDKVIYKNLAGQLFDKVIIFAGTNNGGSSGVIFPIGNWDTVFG